MDLSNINITTHTENLYHKDSVLFAIILTINQTGYYSTYELNRDELLNLTQDSIKPILEGMLISLSTRIKTIKE